MPAAKGGKALPKTKVRWEMISLSDQHPVTGMWTTFSFPRRMVAWPLSTEGPAGSGPNNQAPWWPFFQARHQLRNNYWVQGHMLNDNIHGPGEARNLVPITGTLNTNMLGIVERHVKDEVARGEVLYYEVEAHWEGATQFQFANLMDGNQLSEMAREQMRHLPQEVRAEKQAERMKFPNRKVSKISFHEPFAGNTFVPTHAMLHPAAVRSAYGLIGSGGLLLWGEQFAPTRLSWRVQRSTNWQTAPDWTPASHSMVDLGSPMRAEDWYNNFPD